MALLPPYFVGDAVGLSIVVTLVSVLFWAWVLGPLGAVLAVALWFGGGFIARLFTGDPEVGAAITSYLTIVPVSYGAAGIIAVVNSAFNGLDRPGAGVLISVLRMFVVNVPVAWLGGRLFGADGVFLGVCAANLLVGAGAAWWIWRATATR